MKKRFKKLRIFNVEFDTDSIAFANRYHGFSARATAPGYLTIRIDDIFGPILGHLEFLASGTKEFIIPEGIMIGDGVVGIIINLESGVRPTTTIYYTS